MKIGAVCLTYTQKMYHNAKLWIKYFSNPCLAAFFLLKYE